MSRQGLLDALHDIQLWGIVGQSMVPSLGEIRCGSNDEFLEAYRALEGEVRRLISENEELRKLACDLRSNVCSIYGGEPCSVLCQGYDPGTYLCYYERRLRGLGIEVGDE